jgi:small subunit ribosomal protein S21
VLKKLIEIKIRDGEHLESAIKRFKKKCSTDGILTELRKRQYYEKPSVKKRKKRLAAQKRERKLKR